MREHFSKGKRQPSTQDFFPAGLRTQFLIWNAQTPSLFSQPHVRDSPLTPVPNPTCTID